MVFNHVLKVWPINIVFTDQWRESSLSIVFNNIVPTIIICQCAGYWLDVQDLGQLSFPFTTMLLCLLFPLSLCPLFPVLCLPVFPHALLTFLSLLAPLAPLAPHAPLPPLAPLAPLAPPAPPAPSTLIKCKPK